MWDRKGYLVMKCDSPGGGGLGFNNKRFRRPLGAGGGRDLLIFFIGIYIGYRVKAIETACWLRLSYRDHPPLFF